MKKKIIIAVAVQLLGIALILSWPKLYGYAEENFQITYTERIFGTVSISAESGFLSSSGKSYYIYFSDIKLKQVRRFSRGRDYKIKSEYGDLNGYVYSWDPDIAEIDIDYQFEAKESAVLDALLKDEKEDVGYLHTQNEKFCFEHDVELTYSVFGNTFTIIDFTIDGIPYNEYF